MEIKIKETGKIEEISVMSCDNGVDIADHLIDNGCNQDIEDWEENEHGEQLAVMSQEGFDWWTEYRERYEKANNRRIEARKKVSEWAGVEIAYGSIYDVEFNDMPQAIEEMAETLERVARQEEYADMYKGAAYETGGSYKGYTGGNALSLYVDEKYNVNAAANTDAHDELMAVLVTIQENR